MSKNKRGNIYPLESHPMTFRSISCVQLLPGLYLVWKPQVVIWIVVVIVLIYTGVIPVSIAIR